MESCGQDLPDDLCLACARLVLSYCWMQQRMRISCIRSRCARGPHHLQLALTDIYVCAGGGVSSSISACFVHQISSASVLATAVFILAADQCSRPGGTIQPCVVPNGRAAAAPSRPVNTGARAVPDSWSSHRATRVDGWPGGHATAVR